MPGYYASLKRRLDGGEVIDPSSALVAAGRGVLYMARCQLAGVVNSVIYGELPVDSTPNACARV